jgi:hypothetical protein
MIDALRAVPTDKGRVIFVCGKCGAVPHSAYGAQNKDDLAYLLVCSNEKCAYVLGQWTTTEEKEQELRAFAKRAATQS